MVCDHLLLPIEQCIAPVSGEEQTWLVLEHCETDLLKLIPAMHKDPDWMKFVQENPGFVTQIVRELLNAVSVLHENHIMHRDIKPDNVLLKVQSDGTLQMKLADFGFSRTNQEDVPWVSSVGTQEFLAPELLFNFPFPKELCEPYNEKVEVWAIGVLVYVGCALSVCLSVFMKVLVCPTFLLNLALVAGIVRVCRYKLFCGPKEHRALSASLFHISLCSLDYAHLNSFDKTPL